MTNQLRSVVVALFALSGTSLSIAAEPDARPNEPEYSVWAFKLVNGQWLKQASHTLITRDLAKARAYQDNVNSFQGWKATSNVPSRSQEELEEFESRPGFRLVTIKAYDRRSETATIVIEPTGRTVSVPLEYRLTNVRPGEKSDSFYTDARQIVGKRVFLHLPDNGQFAPFVDDPPKLEAVAKLLAGFQPTQLIRCEQLWGTILFRAIHERKDFALYERGDSRNCVIGRLAWDEGIDPREILVNGKPLEPASVQGGLFAVSARRGSAMSIRHPDCIPLRINVSQTAGALLFDRLQLTRFTPENSAVVRWPLSEFALAEFNQEFPPRVAVMPVPTAKEWISHELWPGYVEREGRDTSLDAMVGKPKGDVLEFRVPPGSYGAHCVVPGRDGYWQRFKVAAGETLTLTKLELPPLTYVVVRYCRHDGKTADPTNASNGFFISDVYSHQLTHSLYSWFGQFSGTELMGARDLPAYIRRDEKDAIRFCVEEVGNLKIADLGAGRLEDFSAIEEGVKWKEDHELNVEQIPTALFGLEDDRKDRERAPAIRSVAIEKGRVYRIDRSTGKYLVEITALTSDFREYAKLVKPVVDYGIKDE